MGNRKLEQPEREFLGRYFCAFRALLSELRAERRLTQEEVSLRGEMDRKAMGRIERGQVDPRFSALLLAAWGLALSPGTFLRALADHMEGQGGRDRVLSEEWFYAPDGSHWIEIRRGAAADSDTTQGRKNRPWMGLTQRGKRSTI